MKKTNILFFILFFSICSGSENGVVSISENTTTTEIKNEEDYPIVLANCLNAVSYTHLTLPTNREV